MTPATGIEASLRAMIDELVTKAVDRRLAERPPTPALSPNMTTAQAAEYLGFSPLTLRQWRHEGDGPPHCGEGRRVRYIRADLDKWLASRKRGR